MVYVIKSHIYAIHFVPFKNTLKRFLGASFSYCCTWKTWLWGGGCVRTKDRGPEGDEGLMHNLSAQKICVWVYEICIHDRTLVVSIVWRTCHIENVEYATEWRRIQSFNITPRKSYIKVCWPTLVRPLPLLVYVLLDHNSGSCGQSRPLAPVI